MFFVNIEQTIHGVGRFSLGSSHILASCSDLETMREWDYLLSEFLFKRSRTYAYLSRCDRVTTSRARVRAGALAEQIMKDSSSTLMKTKKMDYETSWAMRRRVYDERLTGLRDSSSFWPVKHRLILMLSHVNEKQWRATDSFHLSDWMDVMNSARLPCAIDKRSH
jgi:hypothetical protein